MKIQYTEYLHSSKEDNWEKLEELEMKHNFVLDENAQREFLYTLYEVEFLMELDTETGKTKILKVNET